MKCIKCGTELISKENWYESSKHCNYYICSKCNDKLTMERRKTHQEEYRKTLRETSRERRLKLKFEIFELLGNQCVNPYGQHNKPYTDIRCLQIDHVYPEKKKSKTTGQEMYLKKILNLIKGGSKDYQLLCANCNWIKRVENNEIMKRK